MDDQLSDMIDIDPIKSSLITPRISRPVTSSTIQADVIDVNVNVKMPRLEHAHPYISAKAQDMLYGGMKHEHAHSNEHAKIYDKLGMTAKEYLMFKSAGKALRSMGAGHSGLSPAHSYTQRIVHDELSDNARIRSNVIAEKVRKRDAAITLSNASKKAQEILNGKRDKATDRLGVSRNEINQFKTMNKAYQRLGIYDITSQLDTQTTSSRPTIRQTSNKQTDKLIIQTPSITSNISTSSTSPTKSLTIDIHDSCETKDVVRSHLELPHHNISPTHISTSEVISINQLSPASWMRSNSTFTSVSMPAQISPINSPLKSARGSRRIVLQPIPPKLQPLGSRQIIPRVRSGIRDPASSPLPGSVNARTSPNQTIGSSNAVTSSRPSGQQAWKKKAKIIGKVASSLKISASIAPVDPVYPLLSSSIRPIQPVPSSRIPALSPVPSSKANTLVASQSWKKIDSMVKTQRAVRSFQPKTLNTMKR